MDDLDNNLNTKKLISLIEARPALYDKTLLPSNGGTQLKQKLWFDICKDILPEWEDLIPSEQSQIGIKVYKKWKLLRARFKQEYFLRKEEAKAHRLGRYIKKRKPYEFFDQLHFLVPAIANNIQETSEELITCPPATQATSPPSVQTPKINTKQLTADIATKSNGHIDDEDRLFLLSLLPSLRKMTSVQKLKVKMKFLQEISNIEEEMQKTQQHLSCTSPVAGSQDNSQHKPFSNSTMESPCSITSDHSDDAEHNVVNSPIKRIRIRNDLY